MKKPYISHGDLDHFDHNHQIFTTGVPIDKECKKQISICTGWLDGMLYTTVREYDCESRLFSAPCARISAKAAKESTIQHFHDVMVKLWGDAYKPRRVK